MPTSPVPTAPGRLPILGHALTFATRRQEFLRSLRGLGDIVRIQLGPRPAYVVNSPELLRRILATDGEKFDKGRFFDKMRPVLGNGLLTCGTDDHGRQRPLVQPAFHRERIERYVDIMSERAREAAESWRPGETIQVDEVMQAVALDIVTNCLFSSELGRAACARTTSVFPTISGGVVRRTLSPVSWWERLPTAGNRRFAAAISQLRAVVDATIAAYRADGRDHGDLLSMLLAAHDPESGAGLTDRQIRDEAVTIMGAGTETTAMTLSWLFHELDRHPGIRERVHEEVTRVVGAGPLGYDQVRRLTYTHQVANETLRLHSPIWILMRRVTEAVELGGLRLRPGTELILSPTALHRDPELYPDPMRFDPDRWRQERLADLPKNAYLPFGTGPRRCIGDVFARTEVVVVTAVITGRWRLSGTRPVHEVALGSLQPNALPMVVRASEPSPLPAGGRR